MCQALQPTSRECAQVWVRVDIMDVIQISLYPFGRSQEMEVLVESRSKESPGESQTRSAWCRG